MTQELVSAGAAVVAGLCMAAAGVLQQKAARSRPRGERLSLRLMRALLTNRIWLLGISSAALSYGFQAIALATGPLALVQPLIVSELLFAVPVSLRLRHLRLHLRGWSSVGCVVAGLTIAIVAADPQRGEPLPSLPTWLPALVVIAVVTTGCLAATRWTSGPWKASCYALAGACVMGLQSAFYATTIALLREDVASTFITWQPYALIAASMLGMFLIQNAFHAGPVAASVPVIDACLPVVSIGIGIGVFHERVRTAPVPVALAIVGLILLLIGITTLDTSPVVRREQEIEQREQDDAAVSSEGSHG